MKVYEGGYRIDTYNFYRINPNNIDPNNENRI